MHKEIFKKTIIYFLMTFCACGSYMLAHSTFPHVFDKTVFIVHVFDYSSYLLALLLICISTYEKRELIGIASIGVLILVSGIICGDVILVKGLLIVLASKEISTNSILKSYFSTIIFWSVLIIASQFLGIITDVTEERSGGLLRHSLGFSHPNRLGLIIMLLCLLDLFWKYARYNMLDIILNVISIIFLAIVANSKTALIIVCGILLFEICYCLWPSLIEKIKDIVCWCGIIFAPIFSMLFTIMYDSESYYQNILNEIFTGRLYLANKMYELHGFSILGQSIETVTALEASKNKTEVLALDNFYAFLGIQFGVVILIVLITLLIIAAAKISRKIGQPAIVLWITLIMIYGIMENQIIDFRVNFTIVLVLKYLLSGKHLMNDNEVGVNGWV